MADGGGWAILPDGSAHWAPHDGWEGRVVREGTGWRWTVHWPGPVLLGLAGGYAPSRDAGCVLASRAAVGLLGAL